MHRMSSAARSLIFCVLGSIAAALVLAAPAHATVSVDGDFAAIDTFQALNSTDTQSRDKDGSDFVGFGENLLPPPLTGPEGSAKAFVSQASTIITPDFNSPFSPVQGIGFDGRLTAKATKSSNPAPGVPVASPEGEFSVDFTLSDPTKIQFAGSLLARNTDSNDCTELNAELSGSTNHLFSARDGGDCGAPRRPSKGFLVEQVLPAGSYSFDADYSATVDPEEPGTSTASGAADVILAFAPPDTKITSAKFIGNKATFEFKAIGEAKKFECALTRKGKPKFKGCSSPVAYKHLKKGRYEFSVAAVGKAGPEASPATKSFRVK
jgi:hypothetical protein